VWAHSSRAEECTREELKELNGITNDKVLMAFKVYEKSLILRKMEDKQLNI